MDRRRDIFARERHLPLAIPTLSTILRGRGRLTAARHQPPDRSDVATRRAPLPRSRRAQRASGRDCRRRRITRSARASTKAISSSSPGVPSPPASSQLQPPAVEAAPGPALPPVLVAPPLPLVPLGVPPEPRVPP